MVLHRSIVNWRRGVGSICHGYMWILLYMKLVWCNGFPEIYGCLEEWGMGTVCSGICAFFYIWNIVVVVVFNRSMVSWRRGWGPSAMGICAFSYIWNLFGVMVFQKSMVNWRRGWGLFALVSVHTSIWHRYRCRQTPPPSPIDHRCMENHYTNADRPHPFLQSTIYLCKTTTLHQFYGRLTPPPPPIDHWSMEDHYTGYISHIEECTDTSADRPHPLPQLTIDLWKTTTPMQTNPHPLLQLTIDLWKTTTPTKFHI